MAAKGSQSTLNNTDTSAATTLAPASDAQERDANEAKAALQKTSSSTDESSGAKPDSGSSGVKPDSGSSGAKPASGPGGVKPDSSSSNQQESSTSHSTGGSSDDSAGAQSSSGSSAAAAPSYVSSVVSEAAKSGKPHGKNITEGGFDSDPSKNASFTSDIGGEEDPGRAAENQFQRQTLESGNDAAPGVPRQKGVSDDGQYDVLETEQSL